MTVKIEEFILARVAEEEALAWAAGSSTSQVKVPGGLVVIRDNFTASAHRVLTLGVALRALVSPSNGYGHVDCVPDEPPDYTYGHWCEMGDGEWPCATVRLIAGIWSDHPDFDPAWRLAA